LNKLFIIGLPRTGTTSISVALLQQGFKVAHTAYTKRAFELADVISDAPCFSDYRQLDSLFPESKFVYLDRGVDGWLPSIEMLLRKMFLNLDLKLGHFNPVLKRSFHDTFQLNTHPEPFCRLHLENCYQRHQHDVFNYFDSRDDFLNIDVSKDNSLKTLLNFLNISDEVVHEFPYLNVGKQVDSWKEFKHPSKVNPNSAGAEHRKFFDYNNL